MIPHRLQRTLIEDIYATPSDQQPRYLMALIDMATLTNAQRDKVNKEMAGRLHPLLQDSDFLLLQPLGAMLAGPADNSAPALDALLSSAGRYDDGIVQAWITSVMCPEDLARHLSHATFAVGQDGERYLLRYYDPVITPALYRAADPDWVSRFFSPIVSWWFAGATTEQSQWHRIPGGATSRSHPPGVLHLTDALWIALASDPVAHRLLHTLEQDSPGIFASTCKGVRLAQIQAYLTSARQHGLSSHEDLVAYVLTSFTQSPSPLTRRPAANRKVLPP